VLCPTRPGSRRDEPSQYRLLALLVAAAVAASGCAGTTAAPSGPTQPVPHPKRVAVMVLENRSYRQVIGNPRAPSLNRLAREGALATHYFAVTHPSLPNYIALTTGGTSEVTSNCSACATDKPSLLNQLDAKDIPWRAYFESLPKNARAVVTRSGVYNKHYNPFAYTESVSTNQTDRSRVVGFGALRRDLVHRRLPTFSWIAPNVRHDGHNHPLRAADAYASRIVPQVLRALGRDGVLYLTWDEGNPSDQRGPGGDRGGGQVPLIAAGGLAETHARTAVAADHYALLRTVEAGLGLPPLGRAAASSTPLLLGLLRDA
jgi:hypothetical protein